MSEVLSKNAKIFKAPAKINIFLKITGKRGNYHELASRFIRFSQLYDELWLCPKIDERLVISEFKDSIIKKAHDALAKAGYARELNEILKDKSVALKKRIPVGAGLGGGSSDAASFMLMINEFLGLPLQKLAKISASVGADVPFFISGQSSANVSGIGEVIEPFDDEVPSLEVMTPDIFCDTAVVYGYFREHFSCENNQKFIKRLLGLKSSEILALYKNYELNDLLKPALSVYENLNPFVKDRFLSGSGSSLFWLKEQE